MSKNSKKKRDARKREENDKRNKREARRASDRAHRRPNLTTPSQISDEVRSYCSTIANDDEPRFVPVRLMSGSKSKDCFKNVERQVASDGGEIIYGWMIMEWPGVLLEAQFHAVWKSPDGQLVDPTPTEGGEAQILFLPDRTRRYENKLTPSRQQALSDDARDYVRLCDLRWKLEAEGFFDTGEETGVALAGTARRDYEATLHELAAAYSKLVAAHGRTRR